MTQSSIIQTNGSVLGGSLQALLTAQDITPGDAPSYQLCKTIMAFHPLGAKMTDSPIAMAQSQERELAIQSPAEDRLREAFVTEWKQVGADSHIFNCARLARGYGVASLALLTEGTTPDQEIDFKELWNAKIAINVLDPLNTAGSLVLSQDPNSLDFQKVPGISVAGKPYHRSRTRTMLNENPLYIEYTSSAFGYVGRSVFQRPLFPLKSFVLSMITDDMIALKSGVLIAKQKQPGSIIDNIMAGVAGQKRAMVQEAQTNNVISIDVEEDIESLNLQNIDGAYGMARKDILDNIATGADMPAVILNQETFAEGFGEGTEDAKRVAAYIDRIREWMNPLYDFFDQVVMYRAWNPAFFKLIKKDFPDAYGESSYNQAFYKWKNSFKAVWPNLLQEPDSEKIAVEDVKFKAVIAQVEVLSPLLDPENKANMVQWAVDCFNQTKMLFPSQFVFDIEALKSYTPPAPEKQEEAPPAFSARDAYDAAVDNLASLQDRRKAISDERKAKVA